MMLTTFLETPWGTLDVVTEHRPRVWGLGWLLGYVHRGSYGGGPLDLVVHGERYRTARQRILRTERYARVAPEILAPKHAAKHYHDSLVQRARAFAETFIPGYVPVEAEDLSA